MTAPQAAGVIHSDFEKGFIRAETVSIKDIILNSDFNILEHMTWHCKYKLKSLGFSVLLISY